MIAVEGAKRNYLLVPLLDDPGHPSQVSHGFRFHE